MIKKIAFVVLTLIIIFFVIFKFIYLSGKQKLQSPISNSANKTRLSPTVFLTDDIKEYTDSSGFKFSYPKGLSVSPVNSTDQNIYSLLEIKSPQHSGKMTVKIEGSNLTKIDNYFKNKKIGGVTKTKLTDLDARQFKDGNTYKTVALDQEALITFLVDYQQDEDFWSKVNAKITATFAFVQPEESGQGSTVSADESDDSIIEEEEEVIE